ncbi:helix-turn-helix domain-containing protein [Spirillospora sp. NBC_00431]
MAAPLTNTEASKRTVHRMRDLRKARGWSVRVLAQHLAKINPDITEDSVYNLESGRRRAVTIDEAVLLAEVFETTLDDLLSWECSACHGAPPAGFKCLHCGTALA